MLEREPEAELLPLAQEHGVGIIARVPLASGFLAGKFTPETQFAPNDHRYRTYPPEKIRAIVGRVAKLSFLTEGKEKTLAQAALQYCLAHPAVSAVIPGAKTPEQARAKLERHNFSAAPLNDVRRLAALAKDAEGRIVGGAVGRTWGLCCELLQLWVDTRNRGLGVGSHLLDVFEAHARTRGCSIFYLTTLSFQAPEFYRARGYTALAEIDGYPDGIVKFLMYKRDG